MKTIIRVFAGVVFFAGQALGNEPTENKGVMDAAEGKTTWERFNIAERILNLKSESSVRWLYFGKDGSVSATLGIKGGAIAAPIFSYRIVGRWLHIIDEDGRVIYQMRLIKIDKDEILVDNGLGEKERYELSRNEPKK